MGDDLKPDLDGVGVRLPDTGTGVIPELLRNADLAQLLPHHGGIDQKPLLFGLKIPKRLNPTNFFSGGAKLLGLVRLSELLRRLRGR